MTNEGLEEALAGDRHFEQAGFKALLAKRERRERVSLEEVARSIVKECREPGTALAGRRAPARALAIVSCRRHVSLRLLKACIDWRRNCETAGGSR